MLSLIVYLAFRWMNLQDDHGWDPFDFVLHKFLHGDNATRNLMLKLIPHIADGSWVIKQVRVKGCSS